MVAKVIYNKVITPQNKKKLQYFRLLSKKVGKIFGRLKKTAYFCNRN